MTQIIYPLPELEIREISGKRKRTTKRGPGVPHTTVPAEHVLDMRRMHELDRKPIRLIKSKYPQYSDSYIRSVLNYIVRANLRVK